MRLVGAVGHAVIAVILGAGVMCEGAAAAEPLVTPKLSEAARSGWLSFGLVSGRLALTGSRFGSINSSSSSNGRTERLTIRSAGTGPAVRYEMTGAGGEFSLDVSSGNELSLAWNPAGESVPVQFAQKPSEPVVLKIGRQEQEKTWQAPSVWHLWIDEPSVCRAHLLPILKVFQFDMDTAEMAVEIESLLLTAGAPIVTPDQERWATLVAQLGSDSFAQREAADRELREAGGMVASYLERLDVRQYDAEQQYRIHRIIQSISTRTADERPEQISAWLAGDPAIWISLMRREDESVRRLAAERLSGLLGRPVAFDPAADAAARAVQIERLQAEVR